MSHPLSTCLLPTPLPSTLAPYLKTRQEALRVRRILTIYLDSLIEYPKGDHSNPFSFSSYAPTQAVNVKKIPKDVTGLRREYLKALQANVAARREYDAAAEKSSVCRGEDERSGANVARPYGREPARGKDEDYLKNYLDLLQRRERLEKLQIHHHYLNKIMAKEAARPDYLEYEDRRVELQPPSPPVDGVQGAKAGQELDALTERLEKSVLQARRRFEKEWEALIELKGRLGMEDGDNARGSIVGDGGNRVQALQRTKDELVEWIEEQLAKSAGGDEGEVGREPGDFEVGEEEGRKQTLEKIKRQYSDYVRARKSLLEAAATASAPLEALQQGADTSNDSKPGRQISASRESAFPTAIDDLLRLSELHKSLIMLKSHHAESMTEGKQAMLQVLNRLSDESHLIPAYPAPAVEAQRNASQLSTVGDRKDREISVHAHAWSFAAEKARATTKEHVSEKSRAAEESLQEAREGIRRLRAVLGQKSAEGIDDDGDEDDGDIWTIEAIDKRREEHRRLTGPFSGLKGDL